MSFITSLMGIPFLGEKLLKSVVVKIEGGYPKSKTIRDYYGEKYNVYVGQFSYGSMFSPDFNTGGEMVSIGNYCSFASNVHYYGANHPYKYSTMSPFFYNKSFGLPVEDVSREKLNIGNDVWIGYGVVITSSCREIGNGAVIGAGAVVTKDVEPYSIVAGVPAKNISYRFSKEDMQLLEHSKWWQLSPEALMEFYEDIDNPPIWASRIIEKYN